jgi:hypothetical protein
MNIRKPRRWIENFRLSLRADRNHKCALEELGFEEYVTTGLVELSDAELEQLLRDPMIQYGLIKPPKLAPLPPYDVGQR